MPRDRTDSARDAYRFLQTKDGQIVRYTDVARGTRGVWSEGTVRNYRSKKWKNFTVVERNGFRVNGISRISEDEFVALQSQVADAATDQRLKVIRLAIAAGEGQEVEFKASVPSNADDLAKEIAAFATSNDGTILLGVTDAGAIVGTADARERYEGIARNVSPHPTVLVDLVELAGKQVGLIRVQQGPEPVYYASSRPMSDKDRSPGPRRQTKSRI